MKILSLDPGATTGWAIIEWDGPLPEASLRAWGHLEGLDELGRWLECIVHEDSIVIYEDFRLYPHKAGDLIMNDMVAAQAIGVIEYICGKRGVVPVAQMASCAKAIPKERAAKRLHCEDMPASSHQWDAVRHAAYYILRQYNRRPLTTLL